MRAQLGILAICFAGAAMFAASSAKADVDWSGPGYYLYDDVNEYIGGFLSGPFSSQADCNNAFAVLSDDEKQYAECGYFSSDPDADQN